MDMYEHRSENKLRVLREAVHIGAESGIDQVNMVNIARRAHLSTKSVKRYYDTKANLLYQAGQRMLSDWKLEMKAINEEEILEESNENETLRRLFEIHYKYILKHYREFFFLQEIMGYCLYHQKDIKEDRIVFYTDSFLEEEIKKCCPQTQIGKDCGKTFKQAPDYYFQKAGYKGLLMYLNKCIMRGELSVGDAITICDCWIEKRRR